ncbi:MAG: hypothetical protein ACJ75B_17050 [Flavisolibacter sp.]
MNILKIFCTILILSFAIASKAQGDETMEKKTSHYAVYLTAGPNYFFNNVVLGKNLVNEFNYQVTARFMWEPEYFLSLGLETGYYRLYTANSSGQGDVHIVNSAVPLHFLVSMNVWKAYYFDLGVGPSFLQNKVHSGTYGNFDGSSVSLADFSGTLSYRFKWKGHFRMGVGSRFFYSSHVNDKSLALLFIVGYK